MTKRVFRVTREVSFLAEAYIKADTEKEAVDISKEMSDIEFHPVDMSEQSSFFDVIEWDEKN